MPHYPPGLSQGLKMQHFSPRVANQLSWTGQGETVRPCQHVELGSCLRKPEGLQRAGCWCCPLALREAGPGTAARQLSGTHCPHFPSCGHLSLLPYIKSYQLFCQQSHMAPPLQPNGFKFHLLRVMQIKPLTLSEKILFYHQLSLMHLLGVSKSIYT